jgi:hypothetical protein
MRKIFYLFAVCILFISCTEDNLPGNMAFGTPPSNTPSPAVTPEITSSETTLSFSASGETIYINVNANFAWETISVPSWISISPSNAASGSSTIAIAAERNITPNTRTETIILGDKKYATVSITVNQAAAAEISNNYYIVGLKDWVLTAAEKTLKFNHSNKDVYEDPVFFIVVDAPEEDTWFAIGDDKACDAIIQNNDWSLLLAPKPGTGNNGTSGSLDRRSNLSDNDAAFFIPAGHKKIRVIINMRDYTYEVTSFDFAPYFYVVDENGVWSNNNRLFDSTGNGKYIGYYYLNGNFKFKPNAEDWVDDLEYIEGNTLGGTLTYFGEKDCPNPGEGFYQINLDAQAMNYTLTKVDAISIVGEFSGWDNDIDMTYNKEAGCWETTLNLDATKLKFRMNHDWLFNWGCANEDGHHFDDLVQNGANLIIDEAGSYKFQLYISYEGNNRVVVTKL